MERLNHLEKSLIAKYLLQHIGTTIKLLWLLAHSVELDSELLTLWQQEDTILFSMDLLQTNKLKKQLNNSKQNTPILNLSIFLLI